MPKPKTLTLTSGELVTYTPLPVLGGTDEYLETYSTKLLDSGVFDTLSYNGAGMDLGASDFATFGLIGRALVEVVVQNSADEDGAARGGALREVLLDHCKRFGVRLTIGDTTVALDSVDAINEHVSDIGVLFELVGHLAWREVFSPLYTRLNSFAEARRETSAKLSNETSPAS